MPGFFLYAVTVVSRGAHARQQSPAHSPSAAEKPVRTSIFLDIVKTRFVLL